MENDETDRLVGLFINALPIRLRLDGLSLAEALRSADEQLGALMQHERIALASAQRCSQVQASTPLFNTLFNYRRLPPHALGADGRAAADRIPGARLLAAVQRNNHVVHVAVDDTGGTAWISVETVEAIDPARVAAYMKEAVASVVAALADGNPAPASARDVSVIPAEERTLLVESFNRVGRRPVPSDAATLVEAFARQVAATPDALAVSDGATAWTYAELAARASAIARRLVQRGAAPGGRVAIALDRTVRVVAAVLGVLETGCAYVPLDPAYPEDRLRFMVRDSGATVILTESDVVRRLPPEPGLDILDVLECLASPPGPGPLPGSATPESVAYVIYTSGSTGVPKGVLIPHRAAACTMAACRDRFAMRAGDRWILLAPLSFDLSVLEMFGPLSSGGSVLVASREDTVDPERLAALLDRWAPTHVEATPTHWRMLVESGWRGASPLTIITGGEPLTPDLADQLTRRCTRLFNAYGPTETTVYSHAGEVRAGDDRMHVGEPLASATGYVLDSRRALAPLGVPGEIYIGGPCVGLGYHRRPELTAERFVPDPFAGGQALLYRSGDVGRLHADGTLEPLGRLDHQVKVRGHRIELGEIESALERHPAVRQTAVAVSNDGGQLLAWIATAADLAPADMQRFLRDILPDYMIPARYQFLPVLPLTPNHKVDRKALPAFQATAAGAAISEASPLEAKLIEVWQNVLQVRPIAVDDSFFDLGGHSLLALRLCTALSEALGRRVHVTSLFRSPTVRMLAAELETPEARPSLIAPIRTAADGVPYFCVPGAGDNAFIFGDIARHLGARRPVYSFKFPEDVSPTLPPREIVVQVATRLVAELRTVQPRGPYLLGGYCFGGLVAFEMAQQLLASGEPVASLTIFEMTLPGATHMADTRRRLTYHLSHFQSLGWRDRGAFLSERMRKRAARALRTLTKTTVPVAAALTHETDVSPRQAYPGPMTIFRARHQPDGQVVDHDLGWGRFSTRGVQVYEIDGHHTNAYKEPDVSKWIGLLERTLSEAEPHASIA